MSSLLTLIMFSAFIILCILIFCFKSSQDYKDAASTPIDDDMTN